MRVVAKGLTGLVLTMGVAFPVAACDSGRAPESSIDVQARTQPQPEAVTHGEANGLEFSLNARGLATLVYDGHSFLSHPHDGAIQPFAHTPMFDEASEAAIPTGGPGESRLVAEANSVVRIFPWGELSATYVLTEPNNLAIAIRVENRSEARMRRINLQVARLSYPEVPVVQAVGVHGRFSGGTFAAASASQRPPVVLADFGEASLLVGSGSRDVAAAGFWVAENEGLINRAGVVLDNIPAGGVKEAQLILRFGPAGVAFGERSRDLLEDAHAAHPMVLNWPDRRPIGKLFLASQGAGPDQMETNPNRWFFNAKDVDIRTEEGMEAFRSRVLAFAEDSVVALRHMHAQGAITWDPEGQRTGDTYYGDPRIIPAIAPEMEYQGDHELATIDAYFKVFEDAGLLHGICIRPQVVSQAGTYWVQREPEGAVEAMQELDAKIRYAVERWGSRLIYIDSDYNIATAQYRELHDRFPDVLLIPEWGDRTPFTYAYSAPMVSLFHHGVVGTPASLRDFYPEAFVVNLVDNLHQLEDPVQARVLASLRAGDIPMINGWYIHAGTEFLRRLYEESP